MLENSFGDILTDNTVSNQNISQIGIQEENLLANKSSIAQMKKGIFLFFLLLILEGALRKWFLPFLSTPLLLVRDPIAVWILLLAWKNKLFPVNNSYVFSIVAISMVSFFTTIFLGHGNVTVAIFGVRIWLIYIPLIFAIGETLTRDDVIMYGRWLLLISIPMSFLLAIQFYSPQTARVNVGIGGEGSSGFAGANGYFRPSGTFSFTTGIGNFYGLVAPFVCFFWLNMGLIKRNLLIAATVALIVAIPLSISRTLTLEVGISVFFAFVVAYRNPKVLGRMILACMGIFVLLLGLSSLSFFNTATSILTTRFDNANAAEGGASGVGGRFMDTFLSAFKGLENVPFWGKGIGMGTNVGTKFLTGDVGGYLISESEWPRIIGEQGLLVGVFVIFIRLSLDIRMLIYSFRRLLSNDSLPWLLMSFTFLFLLNGQWGQPTILGFSAFSSGLVLACLKNR